MVCPGLNDGLALERTLLDLAGFATGEWPAVLSAAVVPVGLTRYRPAEDGLQPVDPACARRVIAQVEPLQQRFSTELGSRFAWLSDEWYLMAGLPMPPRASYEDLPQEGNGVGSIRAFLEAMDAATAQLPQALERPRRLSWVVGKLVAEALQPFLPHLSKADKIFAAGEAVMPRLNLNGESAAESFVSVCSTVAPAAARASETLGRTV